MRGRGRNRIFVLVIMLHVLCMLIFGLSVQAAVRNGLVHTGDKKTGNYYYYINGKKLTNSWKTVLQKNKKYRFYFGKKGKAVKAEVPYDNSYNVKLYKIGKKKYGFDTNAHLVEKGIYVDSHWRLLVFNKKGVYDEKKTKKLRSRFGLYEKTGKISETLYDEVIAAFGKPLKVKIDSNSCMPLNAEDTFTDYNLKYKYYEIQMVRNDRTNEYAVISFFSRIR